MSLSIIEEELDFDYKTTKRTIRQLNDRLPEPHPQLLSIADHEHDLNKKTATLSALYKISQIPPKAA